MERKKKAISHSHKINSLKTLQTPSTKSSVKQVKNFFISQSTQQFSEDQLKLLNNGLKHAIVEKSNVEQLIIDIESAIKTSTADFPLSLKDKSTIRNITADVIESAIVKRKPNKDQEML